MSRLLLSFLVVLVLILPLLPAGASEADVPTKTKSDLNAVVEGNSAFAGDLYARLAQTDGNLFFSPYSISSCLAMVYAGARSETAEQMAGALHYTLDPDRLHPAFAKLIRQLQGDGTPRKLQLNTTSSLWGQQGYQFQKAFLDRLRDDYAASLQEVDFRTASEQARLKINRWVEEQTQDKIKELVQPGMVGPTTRLVLVNAIYFKAAWMEAFRKENTRPEDFQLADGKKIRVPTMHQTHELAYWDEGSFQLLELPYESGQQSMLVFLPKDAGRLANLEKKLTAQNLESWRTKTQRHLVDVSLPKFKMTAEFKLSQTLAAMGMPFAFDEGKANFSGMTEQEKLWIDEVIHKAFVDVNEEGTEAAAATATVMRAASMPITRRAVFNADHPFVFAIRDNQTGSILFMGRVANPQG